MKEYRVQLVLIVLVQFAMKAQGDTAPTAKKKFKWTIKNVSSIRNNKKHYSDVFTDDCGHKWQMLIFPKGNNVDGQFSMYLGVPDSTHWPAGWHRYAKFSLSVLNQDSPGDTVTKETIHQFNAKETDSGFTRFMFLCILYNPCKGFLVNDTLIFEAEVVTRLESIKGAAGYLELKNEEKKTDETISPGDFQLKNEEAKSKIVEKVSPVCAVEGEPSLYHELRKLKSPVFDETPQSPHYAPLEKYGDIVRKGMMIGLDIAFVNISKDIQNLEDPQSFLFKQNGFMKQLRELEEMGYNVKKLREQLQTLKRIAERDRAVWEAKEKYEDEMKEHEKKINELKAAIVNLEKNSVDAIKEFASAAKRMRK